MRAAFALRDILGAMTATPTDDAARGEHMSRTVPLGDLLGWVREGERLFGMMLGALQQQELLRKQAELAEQENRELRRDIQMIRAEVELLRAERIDAAESLKTIAEQVTQLVTAALRRLGRPVA